MSSHTIDLVYNLALLVALSVVSGLLNQQRGHRAWRDLFRGLLYGGAAVVAMMRPVVLSQGLIIDGRSIMISLCGLFFGPVAVAAAAGMAALYRLGLGGVGTIMGELVIASSALLGLAFHARWTRREAELTTLRLLGFGLLVHGAMLLCMLALPWNKGLATIQGIGGPILITFPLVTLLIGKLHAAQEAGFRSLEALKASEANFRSYVENSPIGVFICDEKGHYLQVNPAATAITGYTRGELLTLGIPDLLPPEAQPIAAGQFRDLQETGRSSGEFGFRRKDGQVGHWSVQAVRLSPSRFLGFATDLTERMASEAQQRDLEIQLQHAHKLESLGILAGGVAHDMNNVLGAILSMASAGLVAEPGDTPNHRTFDIIAQAATRGGNMVRSLLSFARQSPVQEQCVDLNAILMDSVRLLERTTLSKVALDLDLAQGLRLILGDRSALSHTLMNLSVNAVEAMADQGRLTLRTRNLDNGWVEVQVQDTGSGMPREVLSKAMDPFFTTKDVGKGTGLGLSMAYSTVKAHQGEMAIQSEPGLGTTVTLRFPGSAVDQAGPEPGRAALQEDARRPLTILLVDDDELIQRSMHALLKVMGHLPTSVFCGEDALRELEAGLEPDLVILDLNMPGLGGGGTLPRLRTLRPTMPILLATGRADQTALDLVEAHPLVTLLTKPFSMEELQERLKAV
jgi:PAS domain S-box-containing protein